MEYYMPNPYNNIMDTNTMDVFQEISRVFLVIMYALLSKAVNGYHYVKSKYLEYKYATTVIAPTERYLLTHDGIRAYDVQSSPTVEKDTVYIEEWIDTKGHKKVIVLYEGAHIPTHWTSSPFEKLSAKCPWVWVGDRDTEVDHTRTFDKFLVPGNVLTKELVSKLVKSTHLIYIETKTFNQVEFPGDGITIEADDE